MSMNYLELDGIENRISRVGFGCCPLGEHGWGQSERSELLKAVGGALDAGITLFDTADVYGVGTSEKNLAEGLGSRRAEAVIASKCGVRRMGDVTYYDSSPGWMREALEGSLHRLKTDYIDLYQLHYWDEKTPLEEVNRAMQQFVREGKILRWGVTNLKSVDQYRTLFAGESSFSFSFQYSLLDREHGGKIASLGEQWPDSIFLAWGALSQGLLTGKFQRVLGLEQGDRRNRPEYRNFHGERFELCLDVVERMGEYAKTWERSVGGLAIRWILESIPRSIVLVGVKRQDQLMSNACALGWTLSNEQLDVLDKLGGELKRLLD
jgi:myo-inositol catabolism protein IolS